MRIKFEELVVPEDVIEKVNKLIEDFSGDTQKWEHVDGYDVNLWEHNDYACATVYSRNSYGRTEYNKYLEIFHNRKGE